MTPVLIVEDEAVMAQTIGRWLSAGGYPLTYATSAQAAVDAMNAAPAGAAIVDVGLPGGHDGLWLVDQLRRDHPTTAVILATGQDYLPAAATMREGVVSYLLKPFSPEQLRHAVAAAVSWHEDATSGPDAIAALELDEDGRRRALQQRMPRLLVESAEGARRALAAISIDPVEAERSARVASVADALGRRYRLADDERTALHWAGRFHLLCRLTVPESILRKPGALSHTEMSIVGLGLLDAVDLLRDHPFLRGAAAVLRSMREREDGLGHPQGLVGTAIPLASRILSVAEAIEAITHDQPHRPARTPAGTAAELLRCAGTQFDATVVRRAIEMVEGGQSARRFLRIAGA